MNTQMLKYNQGDKQAMEGIAEACQAKVDEYYGQK